MLILEDKYIFSIGNQVFNRIFVSLQKVRNDNL